MITLLKVKSKYKIIVRAKLFRLRKEETYTFEKTEKELEHLGILQDLLEGKIDPKKLIKILQPTIEKKVEAEVVNKKKSLKLKQADLFVRKGDKVYRGNIPIAVPEMLVDEYVKYKDVKERIDALDKFWTWCSLNPNPEARYFLFPFLKHNGIELTPNGMMVLYRGAALKQEGNKVLNDFLGENFFRIRKNKKSPAKYLVIETAPKVYQLQHIDAKNPVEGEILGDLDNLYVHINEQTETVYTDGHSGTTTIIFGQEVWMDRKKVDSNRNVTCSTGLHATGYRSLSSVRVGHHNLAILVNPMNVCAIPTDYNNAKMRCCAYLPIAEVHSQLADGDGVIEGYDQFYTKYNLDLLKELLKDAKFEEYKEINTISYLAEHSTSHKAAQTQLDLSNAMNVVKGRIKSA